MRYLMLMLCLLLLGGCSGPTEPPPSSIKPLDSARVTAATVHLKQDPELATCQISLSAQNDLLVISGKVPNEAAKQRAENLVKKVDGIEKVANHLEVVPDASGGAPQPQF